MPELQNNMDRQNLSPSKKVVNMPSGDGERYQKGKPLTSDNKGFKMLLCLGWKQVDGLGITGAGIKEPLVAQTNRGREGFGVFTPTKVEVERDPKPAQKKRHEQTDFLTEALNTLEPSSVTTLDPDNTRLEIIQTGGDGRTEVLACSLGEVVDPPGEVCGRPITPVVSLLQDGTRNIGEHEWEPGPAEDGRYFQNKEVSSDLLHRPWGGVASAPIPWRAPAFAPEDVPREWASQYEPATRGTYKLEDSPGKWYGEPLMPAMPLLQIDMRNLDVKQDLTSSHSERDSEGESWRSDTRETLSGGSCNVTTPGASVFAPVGVGSESGVMYVAGDHPLAATRNPSQTANEWNGESARPRPPPSPCRAGGTSLDSARGLNGPEGVWGSRSPPSLGDLDKTSPATQVGRDPVGPIQCTNGLEGELGEGGLASFEGQPNEELDTLVELIDKEEKYALEQKMAFKQPPSSSSRILYKEPKEQRAGKPGQERRQSRGCQNSASVNQPSARGGVCQNSSVHETALGVQELMLDTRHKDSSPVLAAERTLAGRDVGRGPSVELHGRARGGGRLDPIVEVKELRESESEEQREIIDSGALVLLFDSACGVDNTGRDRLVETKIPYPSEDNLLGMTTTTQQQARGRMSNTGQSEATSYGGARPKSSGTLKTIEGDLTDPSFVKNTDIIFSTADSVSTIARGLGQKLVEFYKYADLYATRRTQASQRSKRGVEEILRQYDAPGNLIWSTPPSGTQGPVIVNATTQFCYGRPIDKKGEQLRILEMGLGDDVLRDSLYNDNSCNRRGWFNDCLTAIVEAVKSGKQELGNSTRILIPETIAVNGQGTDRLGSLRAAATQLKGRGVDVVLVRSPDENLDCFQLGQASSNWLFPQEETTNTCSSNKANLISYFVEITLGQVRLRALVDSGASCSVLSSAVLDRCQHLWKKCLDTEKTVKGVGNVAIPITATLNSDVGIEKIEPNLNFAIVDANRLPVDAILGNNFLYEYSAIIDMGTGHMTVGGDTIKMIPKYAKNKVVGYQAHTVTDVTIPARSKMLIEAYTAARQESGDGGLFLEPCQAQVGTEGDEDQSGDGDEYRVFFGRSLSSGDQQKILVPVLNPSCKDIRIKTNTLVGSAYIVSPSKIYGEDQLDVEEGYLVSLAGHQEPGSLNTGKVVMPPKPSELFDLSHVKEGRDELTQLLNKYSKVVSYSSYDIGNCKLPPMTIDTGEAEPICIPPRRMGPVQREKIRPHIRDMTTSGILRHSTSAWSSPLVPVAKRDGDVRPCVDLRGLNSVTKFQAFRCPT